MVFHTFGDSHCVNGWNDISGVEIHHLGPKLCYSIGRDGLDLKEYVINENDSILFSFGEIDCRCHIHKHITEINTYQNIIDNIVKNYFEKIQIAISHLKNVKVCIYNVVPTIQKYNTAENPSYPFLGSDEERKKYVLYFNQKLKEECIKYNYIFFDVYDNYIDLNGFLNKSYSDDNVHIKNNKFIKYKLEQLLSI